MAINLCDLTVVVPTRNEERNIGNFLGSIPDGVRLIVVDASTDSTPDIVSRTRPHYTTLIRYPGTVTEARLAGADAANTPWLLFTDADVVFSEEYFGNIRKLEEYDLIYGPKLSRDKYAGYYKWFAYGQFLIHLLGVPAASGSNFIIRREAYLESGGFDPALACNEDSELAWRVKSSGFTAHFTFDLVVYAKDHRRVEMGRTKKTLHSLTRCTALYFGLIPDRWRGGDWGYWRGYDSDTEFRNGN